MEREWELFIWPDFHASKGAEGWPGLWLMAKTSQLHDFIPLSSSLKIRTTISPPRNGSNPICHIFAVRPPFIIYSQRFYWSPLTFLKLNSQSSESLKEKPSRLGRVNSNSLWKVWDKKCCIETAQGFRSWEI